MIKWLRSYVTVTLPNLIFVGFAVVVAAVVFMLIYVRWNAVNEIQENRKGVACLQLEGAEHDLKINLVLEAFKVDQGSLPEELQRPANEELEDLRVLREKLEPDCRSFLSHHGLLDD